jgi:hypothetical protein
MRLIKIGLHNEENRNLFINVEDISVITEASEGSWSAYEIVMKSGESYPIYNERKVTGICMSREALLKKLSSFAEVEGIDKQK